MSAVAGESRAVADDARVEREARSVRRWLSWGSLIPLVGWTYGVARLWGSRSATLSTKLIGTLAFPGGWSGAFVAMWFLARESAGYCYESVAGSVGGGSTSDSGCVSLGSIPTPVSLALTIVVLVAAALGPALVQRRLTRMD